MTNAKKRTIEEEGQFEVAKDLVTNFNGANGTNFVVYWFGNSSSLKIKELRSIASKHSHLDLLLEFIEAGFKCWKLSKKIGLPKYHFFAQPLQNY